MSKVNNKQVNGEIEQQEVALNNLTLKIIRLPNTLNSSKIFTLVDQKVGSKFSNCLFVVQTNRKSCKLYELFQWYFAAILYKMSTLRQVSKSKQPFIYFRPYYLVAFDGKYHKVQLYKTRNTGDIFLPIYCQFSWTIFWHPEPL